MVVAHSPLELVALSHLIVGELSQGAAPKPSTISRLSLKRCDQPSLFKKGGNRLAVREPRSRPVPYVIRAIRSSSTGVYETEESWAQDGVLNSHEKAAVREEKKRKRIIAGVDQTNLVDPHLLADPDSRFAEYFGVQIHHKISRSSAPGKSGLQLPPAVLLHGFGASLFSWERVMPKLAEILGAPVLAFDRPAFGFTSRPVQSRVSLEKAKQKFGSVYSLAFSAAATLAFVDFLQSDKAILIGHSAGALAALEAHWQCPEKVAAMVLVAPALVAPLRFQLLTDVKKSRKQEFSLGEEIKQEKTDVFGKVRAALLLSWVKFTGLVRLIWRFVLLVWGKLVGILFRSPPAIWLVRRIMDVGGPWVVPYAFHDALKADKYVMDGYTRPLQCRDWESALLEFCLALMETTDGQVPGKKRLEDITCPVLVVTGDTDRFVPGWNSKELAKIFPKAEFKLINKCGHLPQEETPEEFLEIIKD